MLKGFGGWAGEWSHLYKLLLATHNKVEKAEVRYHVQWLLCSLASFYVKIQSKDDHQNKQVNRTSLDELAVTMVASNVKTTLPTLFNLILLKETSSVITISSKAYQLSHP